METGDKELMNNRDWEIDLPVYCPACGVGINVPLKGLETIPNLPCPAECGGTIEINADDLKNSLKENEDFRKMFPMMKFQQKEAVNTAIQQSSKVGKCSQGMLAEEFGEPE